MLSPLIESSGRVRGEPAQDSRAAMKVHDGRYTWMSVRRRNPIEDSMTSRATLRICRRINVSLRIATSVSANSSHTLLHAPASEWEAAMILASKTASAELEPTKRRELFRRVKPRRLLEAFASLRLMWQANPRQVV
jgi:hypothetical protein